MQIIGRQSELTSVWKIRGRTNNQATSQFYTHHTAQDSQGWDIHQHSAGCQNRRSIKRTRSEATNCQVRNHNTPYKKKKDHDGEEGGKDCREEELILQRSRVNANTTKTVEGTNTAVNQSKDKVKKDRY